MSILLVAVFILGYLLIALELPLKIDKAASALLTGVICWLVLTFGIEMMPAIHEVDSGSDSHSFVTSALFEPEWGEMVSERGKFKIENIAL